MILLMLLTLLDYVNNSTAAPVAAATTTTTFTTTTSNRVTPVHCGAASGHREFWAMVEIIAAILESLRPLLCDLRTVVLFNFKEVNRRMNGLNFLVLKVSIPLYLLL